MQCIMGRNAGVSMSYIIGIELSVYVCLHKQKEASKCPVLQAEGDASPGREL